jgi:hypothetical protein
MKRGICLVFALMAAAPGLAMAFNADASYNQCVLQSMKGTRSRLATNLMRTSCRKLYKESGLMKNSEKHYRHCLLKNLPGVENDPAAHEISAACGRQIGY